jgi:hypothetical protein
MAAPGKSAVDIANFPNCNVSADEDLSSAIVDISFRILSTRTISAHSKRPSCNKLPTACGEPLKVGFSFIDKLYFIIVSIRTACSANMGDCCMICGGFGA